MRRSPLAPSRSVMGSHTRGRDPVRYVAHALKRLVLIRDGWLCVYCGAPVTLSSGVADHRVPWRDGGRTDMDNLATACRPCNALKGNKSEAEFGEITARLRRML